MSSSFGIAQPAVVDSQVVQAALVRRSQILVAHFEWRRGAKVAAQMILEDGGLDPLAIQVEFNARGFPRAIVFDQQVAQPVDRLGIFGLDFDGVIRPAVGQAHHEVREGVPIVLLVALQVERLVVSNLPSLPMVSGLAFLQDLDRHIGRRACPQAEREGLGALKVAAVAERHLGFGAEVRPLGDGGLVINHLASHRLAVVVEPRGIGQVAIEGIVSRQALAGGLRKGSERRLLPIVPLRQDFLFRQGGQRAGDLRFERIQLLLLLDAKAWAEPARRCP